jgi:hypothetical protein
MADIKRILKQLPEYDKPPKNRYGKVQTVQIGDRIIIADGVGPLRYVDLTTNKVHVYPGKYLKFKFILKKVFDKR